MIEQVLNRIDKRLEAVGMKESRASVEAGLSDSAIRNIRRKLRSGDKNGDVTLKTLAALAPVLKTNVAWLAEGVGPEEGDAAEVVRSDVPLISWVSAGELGDQPTVEQLGEYPTVTTYNLPAGEWIALRVDGASMNKISPPDSIIFVNMRDRALVANACYVIADETGKATYKRYRPNESPSFQPASYKDIPAPKLEGAIRVIGRVRRSVIDM
ncbi:S24 family peptidase [Bartonella sp. HY329]|uniref:S24 family peptidase n=1 Tax=unclassified Bartonella TaxID=2645622 RepID=UPI0021CACA31|nr:MULTISPECIES: S24 family peptidase [unclassified Bartonella]UXM94293.1 S24 family peptidase [Bartonella sp. HY329]UXN08616.1 S24 family peptidase [Bartonella sp. HY328]